MISPRIFERSVWEKYLQDKGCSKDLSKGNPNLETGEWWQTAYGFLLNVPCDTQGLLREDDLKMVVHQIARWKPLDLDS